MQQEEQVWESLVEAIYADDGERLRAVLENLPPGDDARLVLRLDRDEQKHFLSLLPAEAVATLLGEMADSQAAELLRLATPEHAADIFLLLQSNDQADLLTELGDDAPLLLAALPAEAAEDAQRLSAYPPDTAGGVMTTDYLVYSADADVADVIGDLRANASRYSRMEVQYAYIVDDERRLIGVLRLRDLLLLDPTDSIRQAMTVDPHRVRVDATVDELQRFFDRHPFFGIPVVDADERMLGVVLRAELEEAVSEQADRRFLLISGILGGEEFRSMPWPQRVMRRAPWLAASLILGMTAASVIGWYEETLAEIIVLAVFLPVISGLGGNSGNQSLGISIRELSMGLVRPHEFAWVAAKEGSVGCINGLLMGGLLMFVTYVWQHNVWLSVVVGLSIAVSTLLGACLGGMIPLALKRVGWDPALASGPILFTIVDLCGFLFVLALAEAMLPWIMP